MTAWSSVADSAPEFTATVEAILDAHPNKILASLRKDGSPRISAVEVDFVDGDLWLGMMFGSRKARDLLVESWPVASGRLGPTTRGLVRRRTRCYRVLIHVRPPWVGRGRRHPTDRVGLGHRPMVAVRVGCSSGCQRGDLPSPVHVVRIGHRERRCDAGSAVEDSTLRATSGRCPAKGRVVACSEQRHTDATALLLAFSAVTAAPLVCRGRRATTSAEAS